MQEIFKKGQLVPKRLGCLDVHKKARGAYTFGCTVEVTRAGSVTHMKCLDEGYMIVVSRSPSRKHNNGTRQRVVAVLSNVHAQGFNGSSGGVLVNSGVR